jgi:hypothetical protein
MFVTFITIVSAVFALVASDASRRGRGQLIAHRPYENVRDGVPRAARTSTVLDL